MGSKMFWLSVLLASSCAHRDQEMTAAEHRNEAKVLTARAQAERAKYDPKDYRMIPTRFPDENQGIERWNRTFNPSAEHVYEAGRDEGAAARHLRSARRLEAMKESRCKGVPEEERAACPLLAPSVARVTETDAGVVFTLRPDVDAPATYARLSCHLAYAITEGFTRPACPLFVRGMSLSLTRTEQGRAVAMTSKDPDVAEALRQQARRVFLIPPAVSQLYTLD